MYGHHFLYSIVIWINREIQRACRCIRGKYIYMYWCSTAVCISLYTRYIFNLGTCTLVHGSLLYMHIYVTTAVCM